MRTRGGLALILLALGCASPEGRPATRPDAAVADEPARSQAADADAQATDAGAQAAHADAQANVATVLWMDSCLAHLGDYAAQSSWARSRGLRAVSDDFSSALLRGAQGEVWSASNATGDYALVLTKPYQCAVWARRANADVVNANFEKLIKGMRHERLELEREHDRMIDGAGGRYRQIVYFAKGAGNPTGFLFISTTTHSEKAEFQARLTASRAKKEPAER